MSRSVIADTIDKSKNIQKNKGKIKSIMKAWAPLATALLVTSGFINTTANAGGATRPDGRKIFPPSAQNDQDPSDENENLVPSKNLSLERLKELHELTWRPEQPSSVETLSSPSRGEYVYDASREKPASASTQVGRKQIIRNIQNQTRKASETITVNIAGKEHQANVFDIPQELQNIYKLRLKEGGKPILLFHTAGNADYYQPWQRPPSKLNLLTGNIYPESTPVLGSHKDMYFGTIAEKIFPDHNYIKEGDIADEHKTVDIYWNFQEKKLDPAVPIGRVDRFDTVNMNKEVTNLEFQRKKSLVLRTSKLSQDGVSKELNFYGPWSAGQFKGLAHAFNSRYKAYIIFPKMSEANSRGLRYIEKAQVLPLDPLIEKLGHIDINPKYGGDEDPKQVDSALANVINLANSFRWKNTKAE